VPILGCQSWGANPVGCQSCGVLIPWGANPMGCQSGGVPILGRPSGGVSSWGANPGVSILGCPSDGYHPGVPIRWAPPWGASMGHIPWMRPWVELYTVLVDNQRHIPSRLHMLPCVIHPPPCENKLPHVQSISWVLAIHPIDCFSKDSVLSTLR
jgi:hypothetical protein